jgi:hypothetical protein
MIIDDAAKTAANAVSKLGGRAGLALSSVLLPGFLILGETFSLYYFYNFGPNEEKLALASDIMSRNFVLVTLLLLVVLALSYAVGFVSRELAFYISDLFLRRHPFERTLEGVKIKYSKEKVEDIIRIHPVFTVSEKELRLISGRGVDFYARNYCKLWLKTRVPYLSVEYMETEINIFLSLVIPTAGLSLPFLGLHGAGMPYGVIWIPFITIFAATLMMLKINDARRYETEQALVHVLFAHWEDLAKADALAVTRSRRRVAVATRNTDAC